MMSDSKGGGLAQCAHCGQGFTPGRYQQNPRARHYCSTVCARKARVRPAKRVTKICLACGVAVTRFVSQWKGRRSFCSRACIEQYGLIQVRCSWPGCQTLMPARTSQMSRHSRQYFNYKTHLTKRGYYAKFPICQPHVDRVITALGPATRLSSFHRIITRVERGYTTRSLSNRMFRFVLFERASGACQACGAALEFGATKTWQVDHVVPVFRGGASKIDNLQVLCAPCHDLKSAPEKAEAARQRHAGQKVRRWLTHYEKDQLIESLRAELMAARAELARLAERHEDPV